jgi:hypothetical protein
MRMDRLSIPRCILLSLGFLISSTLVASGGDKPSLQEHRLFRDDFLKTHYVVETRALPLRIDLQGSAPEQKSVFTSVVYSLVLPGMGELYAGGFDNGKYFLMAESGLWLTFASFELYGNWLRNDARRFAAAHASASIDGKEDQFFVNAANFSSVYDYNEKKLRDRDIIDVYDPNGSYFWQWDNEQSRLRFRDLRVKSDNVFNNVRFVVGAIIVNHIASASTNRTSWELSSPRGRCSDAQEDLLETFRVSNASDCIGGIFFYMDAGWLRNLPHHRGISNS